MFKITKKFLITLILISIILGGFSAVQNSEAAINKQFNYQGKLTDANGVAVADGSYDIVFKLYTVAGGGSASWTESWTSAALFTSSGTTFADDGCDTGIDKMTYDADGNEAALAAGQTLWNTVKKESAVIQSVDTTGVGGFVCFYDPYSTWASADEITNRIYVRNGLFSIMVGSVTDQTIEFTSANYYLGVAVGADAEMKPRKRIGAVPFAWNANSVVGDGRISLDYNSDSITALSVTQSGTGDIVNIFDGSTEVFTILNGGNIGIGTDIPVEKFSVMDGNIEAYDSNDLGSESLNETDFVTHANWDVTGDFLDSGGNAAYTHSTGAGTLTQTSANLATAGVGYRWYKFTYTVSGTTAGCTSNITTAFASATTALTLTDGTQTTYFQAATSPGNFVIDVTSTAGGFTLDDLTLKEIQGGDVIAGGLFTGGGTSGIKILADGKVGIGTSTPTERLHLETGNFLQTAMEPELLGEYSAGASVTSVDVSGNYAYIGLISNASTEFRILDVSTSTTPVLEGSYEVGVNINKIYVSGKYAYLSTTSRSGSDFIILDISNVNSPTLVGGYDAGTHVYDAVIVGKYAYIVTYFTSDKEFRILDISDPANPVLVGGYEDANNKAMESVYVSGKYAYLGLDEGVAPGSAEFQIVDISNPVSPGLIGSYEGGLGSTDKISDIYVSGKYAYILADTDNPDFRIIDISNPSVPILAGSNSLYGSFNALVVSGNYAYIATNNGGTAGILVFDISNPTNPIYLFSTGYGGANDISIVGKYLYLAQGFDQKLEIYDIAGIDVPTANIGNIATNFIDVSENAQIGDNLYIGGGLNVGSGGIYSGGPISGYVSSTATALSIIQNSTGDIVNIFDGGTEVFTILNGGNIGIGVIDPDTKLEILNAGNQLKLSFDGTDNATFAVDDNGDLTINPSGDEIYIDDHLKWTTDNTYDIGAIGANRPATIYAGTSVVVGNTTTIDENSITGSGALTVQSTSADLTLTNTTSGNIAITSLGNLTETIASGSTYTLTDGTTNFNAINASGAMTFTPTAGQDLSIALSTTGDFIVNTDDLFVDTSSGYVGIGTTAPEVGLHIGTGSPSSLAASIDDLFVSGELEVGETAYLGPMEFGADSGAISWIDMPVTSGASIYTVESYTARIDGVSLLTVYAESNGAGGIQNSGIGIGTATPTAKLSVVQSDADDIVNIFDDTIEVFTILNGGNIGIGADTPVEKLSIKDGNLEVYDSNDLGSESLNETDFATHANWDVTGDFLDSGTNAAYTHFTGVGTLTQTSGGNLAIDGVGYRWYKFTYTVSGVTAGCTANITTAFASASTVLTLTDGTQTTYFQAAASPGNFIIDVTSTAGGFTLDDLTLKEIQGGDVIAGGLFTGGGTSGIKILADGNVGIGTDSPQVALELGADKSLRITGGTSFPSSPSEGQIFFRTDNKQIYIYENSKWQADRTIATKIVAASDSQNKEKADYVCDGTNDEDEINQAISDLPATGGLVYMLEGTYIVDADNAISPFSYYAIDISKNNITLAGAGPSTVIKLKDSWASAEYDEGYLIYNSSYATRNNIHLQNFKLDGNKDNQIANTFSAGIELYILSNSIINEIWSTNFMGAEGIFLMNSNDVILSNNVVDNNHRSIRLRNCSRIVIDNNIIRDNSYGLELENSGGYHIISNNIIASNTFNGISTDSNHNNTITANNIYNNGDTGAYDGIAVVASDNNIISSNRITDTAGTGYAIDIDANSDDNVLVGNIYSGTGATAINDLGTGTKYTMPNRITIEANDTDYGEAITALSVTQSGTGNIIDLKYSSTSIFTLINEDRLKLEGNLATSIGAFNDNLIDDMEVITDWTASTANTPVASETTKVKVNDAAMKITTGGSSTTSDYVRIDVYNPVEDWSSVDRIGFWIQSDETGQIISIQLNDDDLNDNDVHDDDVVSDHNITIQSANEWQYEEWDISGIAAASRNDVEWVQFIIDSVTDTPVFYIDQLRRYNASSATNRMAEYFLDADGKLVIMGDQGVEIWRTASGSSLPAMEFGAATVAIKNPLDLQVEGDVGIEYNLEFLNNGTSYINSAGPLTISAGDSNSYENLTITTGGTGDVIMDIADSAIGFKIIGITTSVFAIDASGNVTIGGVNATDSDLVVKRNISTQGGNLTLSQLSTPTTVAVANVGAAGAVTYGYRISALNGNGETFAAATETITTGNATLSATNYNRITWDAVVGATSYKIYGRTSASELYMAEVDSPTLYYNDDGTVVTSAGALPSANTTGGKLAINTTSPSRRFEVLENTSAIPQMKIISDGSNYTEFYVDSTGDLSVGLSGSGGDDIIILDENLKICAGGSFGSVSCPSITMSGTGNLVVENDIYAAGGYKNSFNFTQSDVADSQTTIVIDVLGLSGNTEYTLPYAGSITGISVSSNDARTAGTLTVDATVNGTTSGLQAVLDVTNTQYHSATQGVNTDIFSAGNRLGVKITTSADWAPTTADIVVTVVVEF